MLQKVGIVYSQKGLLRVEKSPLISIISKNKLDGIFLSLDQLCFVLSPNKMDVFLKGQPIPKLDFLYIRHRGGLLIASALFTKYCSLNSITQANAYHVSPIGIKILQYSALIGHRIQFPKTLYATSWNDHTQKIFEKHIGFPCILKANSSYAGKDNYKVDTLYDLKKLLEHRVLGEFVIQECIFAPGDYRVLVLGNKARVCEYRQREDAHSDHRNYGTHGFTETVIPFGQTPKDLIREAQNVSKVLGFEVAGLDFIIKDEINYFLECNSMPGLGGSSKNPEAFSDYLDEVLHVFK